jgi:hypothetical protein
MQRNRSAGNDRVLIEGGGSGLFGSDRAVINAGNDHHLTVVNERGRVLFQRGSRGTVVTLRGIDHVTVNGGNGRPLYLS